MMLHSAGVKASRREASKTRVDDMQRGSEGHVHVVNRRVSLFAARFHVCATNTSPQPRRARGGRRRCVVQDTPHPSTRGRYSPADPALHGIDTIKVWQRTPGRLDAWTPGRVDRWMDEM